MSKYGRVEFIKAVDVAYKILWDMYKPVNKLGCDWDSQKEQILVNILNFIDNELER